MLATSLTNRIIPPPSRYQDPVVLSAVEEHIAGCFVVNLRVFAETMVNAVLAKCTRTHGHSQRVGVISYTAAHGLGLKKKQADYYYIAGLLHDIGKIGLSDALLAKMKCDEPFSPEEEAAVRRHPQIGAQVIDPLDRTMDSCDSLSSIILHHHELYDGSGYPGGLRGSQIPLGARIVGCADALTVRIERGDTLSDALEHLAMRQSGKYDPKVIAAVEQHRSKAEVCLKEISIRRQTS